MKKSILPLACAFLCSALISGCAGKTAVKTAAPQSNSAATSAPQPSAHAEAQKEVTPDAAAHPPVVSGSVTDAVADAESRGAQDAEALQAQLEVLYFNFDSAALEDAARDSLQRNFQLLKDREVKVQIEGHCDERGSEEYNLALGEKRAQAALRYLVNLGLAEERLSTISYGKEKPAVQGESEESWAKNRRAELVVRK